MTGINGVQHRRKALILSPSASHPQDHGNRNRVFQTTSFLKDVGYEIHFILYPFESDWVNEVPESAVEMRRAWASFIALPPSRPLHMAAAGEHHLIDEWWDPQIGTYLQWLFAREWFDVFVVNYTFLSKALDYAPGSTVKVLETHDMFAGRKELFTAHGAPAEFFYTTREQEQIALDRADIVIAIKDAEAAVLRRNSKSAEVISIPFYIERDPLARRLQRLVSTEELRVGFIGALNSVNVLNMQRFLERFEKYRTIYMPPPISISVAGGVCLQLSSNSPAVNLLGRVEDITTFYQGIDVIVAPMSFSTGIKIKVGEALSCGKPVVATQNGFDGFPAVDPFHNLESVDAVCRALVKLAFDRERLLLLEERTAVAARLAHRRCLDGYSALNKAVLRRSRRIAFITDAAIWNSQTVREVRLAQWCELCTYITRTAVIYVGADEPGNSPKTASQLTRCTDLYAPGATAEDALMVIDTLRQSYEVIEVVLSVKGDFSSRILGGLKERVPYVTLDAWLPDLAVMAAGHGASPGTDLWLAGEHKANDSATRAISTTAMRYLPAGLDAWRKKKSSSGILIALCAPDPADLAGVDLLSGTEGLATSIWLADFRPDEEGGDESALLNELKQREMPRLILSVGPSSRAAEVARCVASYWRTEYLRISAAEFPYMLGSHLAPLICSSFADIAGYLCAHPGIEFASHSGDVGWSTYWRTVTKRKSADHPRNHPKAALRHASSAGA